MPSSCELTALYRSRHPEISKDELSGMLVTQEGKQMAYDFIKKYKYPLASRKIAVLAGFFLREARELLESGQYDSCISFASGLSMLLYLLKTQESTPNGVRFIDSDVADVIALRNERITAMQEEMGLDSATVASINAMVFDIEQAYENGTPLTEVFPDCKRPLFILDGVSYFLSKDCVDWLMEQMASFDRSAVMLYYWPEDMNKSVCFQRFTEEQSGRDDFSETIVSYWSDATREKFAKAFPQPQDLSLGEVEDALLDEGDTRKLTDFNHFFPVRAVVGTQVKQKTVQHVDGSTCCVVS